MMREVVDLLVVKQGGTYIDGTLGNGGHTRAIIERAGAKSFVMALDRDELALERAGKVLDVFRNQVCLVHGNFSEMAEVARSKGINTVDGVLLDLGVSSEQLDEGCRGFSFMRDGPLDMRMDQQGNDMTAADLVNGLGENELCEILIEFGEEKMARRVVKAIAREREIEPIRTTGRLAGIVERAMGGRRGRVHPATKTFQALRIKVNDELGSLKKGLEGGLSLLGMEGRMAVISFHSLEDRIVKRFFAGHSGKWESLQGGGAEWVGEKPRMQICTKKPIEASIAEMDRNPRARSAKLRVAEKSEMM